MFHLYYTFRVSSWNKLNKDRNNKFQSATRSFSSRKVSRGAYLIIVFEIQQFNNTEKYLIWKMQI